MGVYAGIEKNWASQTNVGRTHIATKGIVQSGLVLNLDAGVSSSYPGSGTTWTDLSGSGNNGTLTNMDGTNYSSTNGGSLSFDGTNEIVNLGSTNNITGDNLQTLTASVWVKYSTTSGDIRVFTLNRGSGGLNSSLLGVFINSVISGGTVVADLGSLGFFTRNFDNSTHTSVTFNDNYHLKNRFINVACVVDGTNRFLYIDGVLKNSDSGNGIQSVSSNTDPAYIASGPQGNSVSTYLLNGSVSNVIFYRRALSASEISQNFNALRGRFGI